ncbi:MAG: hypothetical protein ACLQBJ_02715 [Bryobacteraceae bacterium]
MMVMRMPSGRLDSWKEIAAFIGKDAKTAQRWERQRGLPVHRTPGAGRGSVFAFTDALQAWLMKGDLGNARAGETEDRGGPAVDPPVSQTRVAQDHSGPTAWSRRRLLLAGGSSVGALGLAALWRRSGDGPESVEITGRVVTAFDEKRREQWQFRLLETPELEPPASRVPNVTLADLDGSGKNSVLIRANYVPQTGEPREGELICLDWHGAVRWRTRLEPDLLDFDGKPFVPEWHVGQVLVTGKGAKRDVWCFLVHVTRWSSCLWKIDASGRRTIQFYSYGHIQRICPFERDGRLMLALGGIDSSVDRPFITVLDSEGQPVTGPSSERPRYHYANQPSSIVSEYVLLPQMEMDQYFGAPFASVHDIAYTNPILDVRVGHQGIEDPTLPCTLYYFEFTDHLRPLKLRVGQPEPLAHAAMERKGLVHHTYANCPEHQKPLPLLRWSEGKWISDSIPWALAGNTV